MEWASARHFLHVLPVACLPHLFSFQFTLKKKTTTEVKELRLLKFINQLTSILYRVKVHGSSAMIFSFPSLT